MDRPTKLQNQRRSLDHYVVQVHDLQKAGGTYERLGFQVMPRMQHVEIGSANRVIQFGSTYLELIGELENAVPLVRANLADRFDCGEGLTMVSLNSSGLEADHGRVQARKLDPAPIISARRKVTMPDGRVDETDSRCFYIWRPERRYLSLFLSQHYKPGVIWTHEFQQHPNTALET
ncbi:MAG: VOC family protein, partial [Xanthomonadales bacterium]|nr:VOC family protein [Xanthomonadales bacterium]